MEEPIEETLSNFLELRPPLHSPVFSNYFFSMSSVFPQFFQYYLVFFVVDGRANWRDSSNFLELHLHFAFVFFSSSICAFVFFLVVFVPCVFIFVHFVMVDEPIEETPATFLSCLPHFTAHYILANFSLTVLHNKNVDCSFLLNGFNWCLFMYLAL